MHDKRTVHESDSPSEAAITDAILTYLGTITRAGLPCCIAIKIHSGGHQGAGLPDIHCTYRGQSIWLEVKTDSGKPTPLQLEWLRRLKEAGAVVGVVRSVDEVKEIIDICIAMRDAANPPKLQGVCAR